MRHLSTLLLTSLIFTGGLITSSPAQLGQDPRTADIPTINAEPLPDVEVEALPDAVRQQVQTALTKSLDLTTDEIITRDDIAIARYSRETWSDSCLGLGGPAESCLAALTEGWQVEAIYNNEQYFYRTDLSGSQIRPSTLDNNLPPSLQTRILQTAQIAGLGDTLSITEAQTKLWDGCYGLPTEADICSAIGIYGWQTIVTDGDHYWIYHTDNLGNTILLNELASTNTAIPRFMNTHNFETLAPETSFQSDIVGSVTGSSDLFRLDISTLNTDGQVSAYSYVTQEERNGTISPQQLEDFYTQLTDKHFHSFNGLAYVPKLEDTANYRGTTLRSQNSQVAFIAPIFNDLPPQLQTIIQSWRNLQPQTELTTASTPIANNPQTALPENIQSQVRFNLAIILRASVDRITIQNYSQQTWPDGCLGLGGANELCLAALTEGWQVEAIDTETNETYVYRTNLNGDQIRREP